ncbi:hypothetical protein KKA69_02970 [Patescibacteria group bacterium]|nr:hypothetical protein [Patescibacteria group bacterium]
MKPINHKVPLIQQKLQDCVQASAAQILSFYGIKKDLKEIKKEVPVYISKNNKPLGSSLGHIGTYFLKLGLEATIHTTDTQIFDRSWQKLTKKEIIGKLIKRKKYIKHPIYQKEEFNLIFDGYISFLKSGGKINFPIITNEYIYNLLQKGPIYAVINFQFLNSVPKYTLNNKTGQIVKDDIKGNSSTHAIVISGFKNNKYIIVDPDENFGGVREIEVDHLLGSFYLAQTDYDNLLISLAQKIYL